MDYSVNEDFIEHIFENIKSWIIPSQENNYKSRFLQSDILLYCVILLLALKIFTGIISINFPKNIFFADILKSDLVTFINQARQTSGLKPLAQNSKLDQAAQLKAENMVQNNYFDHTSPSGITPWYWFIESGYNYKYAGENLAIGFFDSKEVYDAWLNSPSHKANILNPNYTEVGTAVLSGFGPNNSIVVVQEFGSPQPIKTVVAKNNNVKPVLPQPKTNKIVAVKTPALVPAKTVSTPLKPVPAASTINNNAPVATNNSEKVLSQSTESPSIVSPLSVKSSNNLASKIFNSVAYNYSAFLQNAIYGVSLIVIGILLTLIFFNFNISLKRQLVFRSILIIALLSVATLLNKEIITSLIPHQIVI